MGTHNCLHERSLCINTVGGFFCRCEAGYTGNGIDCEGIPYMEYHYISVLVFSMVSI